MSLKSILCFILILLTPGVDSLAQGNLPSWCPLEEVVSTEPVVAPIEFGHGRLLYRPPEGEPVPIDDSGDVSGYVLSADRQRIAAIRRDNSYRSELWTLTIDGRDARLLLNTTRIASLRNDDTDQIIVGIGHLEWSRDGATLIFNTSLTNIGDGIFTFVPDDLWAVGANTGELVNLLPSGQGGDFIMSPDGRQMVIQSPDRLSLINSDGTNFRPAILDTFHAVGFGEYYGFPPVVWLPDSSALLIAMSSSVDPYSQHEGSVTLWSVTADSLKAMEMATFDALFPVFYISPDLQFVAYWHTDKQGSNNREIIIARIDGSEHFNFLRGRLIDFNGWVDKPGHFIFTDEQGKRMAGDICGGIETLPGKNN